MRNDRRSLSDGLGHSRGAAAALLLATLAGACSDAVAPSVTLESGRFIATVTARATAPLPVAYVSLPPGQIPGGTQATLHTVRIAGGIVVPLIDGGFDPVQVPAAEGDTITISVATATGTVSTYIVIPRRSRPTIVRTTPSRGKRDVAVNSRIAIVVSEPVDPATLTASSVQLRSGSAAVPGQIRIADSLGTRVEFIPAALLADSTDYVLVLTEAIRDREGEALIAASVPFTTGTGLANDDDDVSFGAIRVVMMTTGSALPPSVLVRLDGQPPVPLAANDSLVFVRVVPGTHRVWLDAVASNCVPARNEVSVSAVAADTVAARFLVTCGPTSYAARVTTVTTGANVDADGYDLFIGDDFFDPSNLLHLSRIGINETVGIAGLPQGTHPVYLTGVSWNCQVLGGPQVVTVTAGRTADVRFEISCAALGNIQLTTSTSGLDVASRMYSVDLSNAGTTYHFTLSENSTTSDTVAPGGYAVRATGLAPNCEWAPGMPASISVTSGSTTMVTMPVVCTAAQWIAYVQDDEIHAVRSNGTGGVRLTMNTAVDDDPHWSPDGTRLAFTSDRAGNRDIFVMLADGSNPRALTTQPAEDYQPAWSPDGTRIAFVSTRDGNAEIYVSNADGTNAVRLTSDAATDEQPDWSPDGSRIAFRSTRNGTGEIHVMNMDGTGVVRLTQGGQDDSAPAWSPDGLTIAFSRERDAGCSTCVMTVSASGSGSPALALAGARHPAWSPNGRRLAFTDLECDAIDVFNCYDVIRVARPDGTDRMLLAYYARSPAWQR